MKKETREKLNNLHTEDIYSLMLFALFKLKDVPEYSSISELAYLLDGKGLLNLLEYYGGTTIKVPTLNEFKVVIQSLLLYQYVNVEGIEYNQAIKLLDTSTCSVKSIKDCYKDMVDILSDYEFRR